MSLLPTSGLGRRVAYYRKLNGWSAERLAQEAGEGVTRAILAQLESGRRDSLSVQQFMAISIALGVPPAGLLADALNPDEEVELPRSLGGNGTKTVRLGELMQWVSGSGELQSDLPSGQKWSRLNTLLWRRYISNDGLLRTWFGTDTPDQTADEWVELAVRLGRQQRENQDALRAEGVNLPPAPPIPATLAEWRDEAAARRGEKLLREIDRRDRAREFGNDGRPLKRDESD